MRYCDYACYRGEIVPVVSLVGAGIDSLPLMGLLWASDFQRAVLSNWDN
jgi:hypothetical protein